MSSVLFLKELWRRRLLVAAAVLVAGLAALLVVYRAALFPPSLSERQEVDAEGSIQVLVDSANSPIANAHRPLSGLTARAGVFARVMSGGNVIRQAAAASDIPFRQIQVAGPMPLPGEAPGISEGPARELPYRISIIQQTELPILSVVTKAPTVPEARALAAAVPRAMSARVHAIQRNQETPAGRRVEFRTLGPAQAGLVDDSSSKKIAVGVFVFLLALFLTLIVGLPRFLGAWRAADAEPQQAAAKQRKAKRRRRRPKLKKPKEPARG
ncbi:MAG TPA: hypothetical protein VMH33_01500 [Solirubrobacterales bacterium]|nr:hypothetical protein [Solirubrobacterales bacterium]